MGFWFEEEANSEQKKPQYPYNNATVTASGHAFEMDDTPGNERIRLQHRAGSYQEYTAQGNVTHKIVGTGFNIFMKDNNVIIQGQCNIEIYGDAEISCKNLSAHVKEDANIMVEGDLDINCDGDMGVTTTGDLTLVGDSVTLQAVDAVYIDSDLHVRGDIIGEQSISSYGNMTAGGHCYVTGAIQVLGVKPASPSGVILPNIINNTIGTAMLAPLTTINAVKTTITSPSTNVVGVTSVLGATSIKGYTSITGGMSNLGVSLLKGFTNVTGMKLTMGMDRDMGGTTGLATHVHPPIPSKGIG